MINLPRARVVVSVDVRVSTVVGGSVEVGTLVLFGASVVAGRRDCVLVGVFVVCISVVIGTTSVIVGNLDFRASVTVEVSVMLA